MPAKGIHGVGIDLVDVARFRELAEGEGSFLERAFTPAEIATCVDRRDRVLCLAARFAAKEAAMKALGRGDPDGTTWREIEVVKDASGRPGLRLHGAMAELAGKLGVVQLHLSLTHVEAAAAACVVAERNG